jgi:hypothetical protein
MRSSAPSKLKEGESKPLSVKEFSNLILSMDSCSMETSSEEDNAPMIAAITTTVRIVPMVDAIIFPTRVAQTVFQKVIVSNLN